MKCEECLKVIEDYFDAELEERQASNVRLHLMGCDECARSLEALHDERNVYGLYRRDIEVGPALWTAVAARIHEEKASPLPAHPAPTWLKRLAYIFGTPRLSPALAFALLVLAVGSTAGLMKYMQSAAPSNQAVAEKQPLAPAVPTEKGNGRAASNQDGQADTPAKEAEEELARQDDDSQYKSPPVLKAADRWESKRPSPRPESFRPDDSPDQLVREAEQKYMAAIALLTRDAKRRRTLLEPDVRARFEQTLATVDRTIQETRRAARNQPDDPAAVQYMLAAYAKKVEVLREMAIYKVDDRDMQ